MGRKEGWRSLWRMALLAASILSSCFLLIEGQDAGTQIQIQVQPEHPREGQNVTLTPQGSLTGAVTCDWYRGWGIGLDSKILTYFPSVSVQNPGPAFTHRETGGPGCSLHIRNLSSGDTGNYTVSVAVPGLNAVGYASVVVSVILLKPTVSVTPSTILFEFTGSVQLTCITNSRDANVSWLWNGGPLNISSRIQLSDDDWILSINNVERSDAGKYQCQVSNLASKETSDITNIDVIYGPDAPVIQPDTPFYNFNSNIELTCAAGSFPAADYFWFFNEKKLVSKSKLILKNVTRENSGNYTCNAENALSHRIMSTTLAIVVVGDVYDVTIVGSPTAIENKTVSLNCTCIGTNVSYSWYKGDLLMQPGGNVVLENNNQTLTFNLSTRNDTANYTCYAFNNLSSNSSEPYSLEISYGPDALIISPQETVYSMGSNLSLSCFATSNPPANYSWSHNGAWLEQETTSQLLIRNLSWLNEGLYTCNATNDVTGRNSDASLKISLWKPVTNVSISGPDKAIENNVTVLNCSSDGTNVSYYWLKENQSLVIPAIPEHIFLLNNNQTLMFNPTMRNDSGNYTCHGYNSLSEDSANYTLNVSYGPDAPIISPQETVYSMGSNLSLSCFATSNPPANYSWYHNGAWLEQETTSQLLIRNLSWLNEGLYTCNATNDVTGRNSDASLKISLWKPVTNVSISGPDKAIENNVTVLNCSSDGTNVSYYWLKENQSPVIPAIPEHIFLLNNNQTLMFNPTMRNDSGNYTCHGYNSLSEDSAYYTLNVSYGPDVPKINPPDTPKYLAEGTTFNLSCDAVSNPSAQYTWFFNDSVEIGNQSQLLLSNVTISSTGNYSCRAFNSKTNNSKFSIIPMEIYVRKNLSDPTLESTADGMVEENTNVTLNCRTSDSTDVSVFWFKDGKLLSPAAGLSDNNRTLLLVHVTKTDTGLYRCNSSNIVSNTESNLVNITVAYGPDDIKLNPEGTIEKTLNSNLKLECTVDSVPPAKFQWLVNNITRNVTGNIFQVQLSNWTDEGNYSCKATNPFTNRTALRTTYVKLTEVPGPNGSNNGLPGGAIAGIVIGSLAGVVLVSGLLYYICTKTSFGRKEQHASNGNVPSAPGHNEGVTDTKPKAAEEDIQYSILAFKDHNSSPPPRPTSEAPQPSDGVTIYSEIKKK